MHQYDSSKARKFLFGIIHEKFINNNCSLLFIIFANLQSVALKSLRPFFPQRVLNANNKANLVCGKSQKLELR